MKIKAQIVSKLAGLSFVCILCFETITYSAEYTITNSKESDIQSVYPITPEDSAWNEMESIERKVAACRIPEEQLGIMSNDELIQAILDFPFLCDIFLYSSIEEGVRALEKISDAYVELLSREDSKDSIMNFVEQRANSKVRSISAKEEVENEALIALMIYQEQYTSELTYEETMEIVGLSQMYELKSVDDSTLSIYASSVRTPNGTIVLCETPICSHATSGFHAEVDKDVEETYGVTLVQSGSCTYNCHSYAWYSTAIKNPYWIITPYAYMTDGSYEKVMSGLSASNLSVDIGDKVFYGTLNEPTHSAILVSSVSGQPLATKYVRSKWGKAGVFYHKASTVPSIYDTQNVSVWSR